MARTTEQLKVRELQRTLYRAAKADPARRFHALYDKVSRRDVLERAWELVRANKGAAGIDQQTIADVERYGIAKLLDELAVDLREGRWRPLPARRVFIPKPGREELRPLSIPAVRDRIVQTAVKLVIEPVFEADFLPCSFGFRPKRSQHDALQVLIDQSWKGRRWVLESDIANCLVPSSHCQRVHGSVVKQGVFRPWDQYSQALSASVAHMERLQLAALDTLQHRLARDAEDAHGVDDRDVASGGVLDEARAQLVVDADPPGRAGSVLLAADEAGLKPAEDRRGGDAQHVGGLADWQQLAVGRLGRRFVCGDAAVAAQAADDDRAEALAGGRAAPLAVENAGDRAVVVVGGEPSEQRDRVLVGADRRLWLRQRHGELGERTAAPADRHGGAALLAVGVEDHLLDQRSQKRLAIAVAGGRRRPHTAEIGAESQELLALLGGEGARALSLAQRELGLGLGELCERLLPVALKTAGDE